MMGSFSVREMKPVDLVFAAELHMRFFPDGFFPRLGRAFLIEYYRSFLDSPTATAIVAERDGAPCGYLVGMLNPVAHRREVVRRHGRRLALRAVGSLAVRPRLAVEFTRTRLHRYGRALFRQARPGAARPGTPGPSAPAVLSHVAVADPFRAAGAGTALVEHLVASARAAGRESVCLVTRSGDDGAGPFYTRLGWTLSGTRHTDDGLSLDYYTRSLTRRTGEVDR